MIFITETGSTYEVLDNKVRRLNGASDPTPRIGLDGEFKEADEISDIEVGKPVVIMWKDNIQPPPQDGTLPATQTSRVVQILEDNGDN